MSFEPAVTAPSLFRICFVCTGNICRSPMAEAIFRRLIVDHGYTGRLRVESAATGDWHVGERADPRTIAALASRGYDATGHRARQFDPNWFEQLDLVIAFDRGQERTLRQWAPSESDRAKVQLLMTFEPEGSGTMDVPDPYYSDAALFDSVLATIEGASIALFHQLEPEFDRSLMNPLPPQPVSPLDGRYRAAVQGLGEHLSEAGLNRARVHVEVEWLIALTSRGLFGANPLDAEQTRALRTFASDFGQPEIDELASLEATTRHDVKAVEYLVRGKLSALGLNDIAELTHFACTSEDINNLSYALTIRAAVKEVWMPRLRDVLTALRRVAVSERATPMLAHTHGQPATPTTVGKEFAVFVARLERVLARIEAVEILAKFSGATGTFAAHVAADPDADWPAVSREFVTSLGLSWNPLTTQIESHDWQAELFTGISHLNRILHNLCTDIWTYISMGYITQIPQAGATGSSTMPHKINPIRFENAEANLELSSALFDSLASTLVTSRMQRDLTDSTTQRNIGVALGHSLLALDNLARGLDEIAINHGALAADLDGNWEVLAEAIQTVIRAEVTAGRSSIADPYALLKELTRGHRVGAEELRAFVDGLDIGVDAKGRLLALTPATYTGLAAELVDLLPE